MFAYLRGAYGKVLSPLARLLLRWGLSPTTVTVLGTGGVCLTALWLLPRGEHLLAVMVLAVFLLGDGLDGTMARISGRDSSFGAFLDATLDRLADAAIFAGIALWAADRNDVLLALALACLSLGFLVSYARARAAAEGWDATVGLFERTDRIVVTLASLTAFALGAPQWVLTTGLTVVAVGSAVTAGQRIMAAWHHSVAAKLS